MWYSNIMFVKFVKFGKNAKSILTGDIYGI